MSILGQRKPKTVQENLGLDTAGGIVSPPASPMNNMVQGGAMGSLTEQAMQRKKMNGELGGQTQSDPQALFNNKKKKRMNNGGFTNESSGLEIS